MQNHLITPIRDWECTYIDGKVVVEDVVEGSPGRKADFYRVMLSWVSIIISVTIYRFTNP